LLFLGWGELITRLTLLLIELVLIVTAKFIDSIGNILPGSSRISGNSFPGIFIGMQFVPISPPQIFFLNPIVYLAWNLQIYL